MKINNINSFNTRFKSVTPVYTRTLDIEKIEHELGEHAPDKDFCIVDCTDLYRKSSEKNGLRIINRGTKVGLLVTGQEYIKYRYRAYGWDDFYSPSRHINRAPVEIEDIYDNKAINTMLERVNENPEDPGKLSKAREELVLLLAYLSTLMENQDNQEE